MMFFLVHDIMSFIALYKRMPSSIHLFEEQLKSMAERKHF